MTFDFTCDKARWSMDSEGDWISLRIHSADRRKAQQLVDEVDKPYSLTVKPYRKKRSLDANAYCFVLIDKIAHAMRLTKEEVYREAIRNIGGNSEVVCVQDEAVDRLCQSWSRNGLGWLTETFPSKLEGCTNVRLYFGSSTYDTKQMSVLIDHVIQEAKSLGIETMTPAEIDEMITRFE